MPYKFSQLWVIQKRLDSRVYTIVLKYLLLKMGAVHQQSLNYWGVWLELCSCSEKDIVCQEWTQNVCQLQQLLR